MALLSRFDTPASIRDVPESSPFYAAWSDAVRTRMGNVVRPGDNGGAFYNPAVTDVSVAGEKRMVWMGFPREVLLPGLRDDRMAAYVAADASPATRSAQNEYFEWRVDRNAAGKIRKLTFVTELRLYYHELWRVDPAAVLAIYRALVSPAVQQADLGSATAYNEANVWNTTRGIVHLIQRINTLPAAIGLCQDAVRSPAPARDNYEARPGLFSRPTAVDPRVSYDVHMLVRKGLYVSLRDPIGLYIVDWNNAGLAQPNGRPAPLQWWRVTRGRPGMAMRLEYEVPPGLGFVVGDMSLGGRPIEYGGQLAEQVTVSIAGVAGTPTRGA